MGRAEEFLELLLESISKDAVTREHAAELHAECQRLYGVVRGSESLQQRIRGLEQGIHAAHEQTRRVASRAQLAFALDSEPCRMVAELTGSGAGLRMSTAATCTRTGTHDEHRFRIDDDEGRPMIEINLRLAPAAPPATREPDEMERLLDEANGVPTPNRLPP